MVEAAVNADSWAMTFAFPTWSQDSSVRSAGIGARCQAAL